MSVLRGVADLLHSQAFMQTRTGAAVLFLTCARRYFAPCAASAYLDVNGIPQLVEDLTCHSCLAFTHGGRCPNGIARHSGGSITMQGIWRPTENSRLSRGERCCGTSRTVKRPPSRSRSLCDSRAAFMHVSSFARSPLWQGCTPLDVRYFGCRSNSTRLPCTLYELGRISPGAGIAQRPREFQRRRFAACFAGAAFRSLSVPLRRMIP